MTLWRRNRGADSAVPDAPLDDDPYREYVNKSLVANTYTKGQSASVVQIESSKLMPMIVLLAVLSGSAIGLTAFSFTEARNAEREARMLQYYLLELDAKIIAAGIKKPEEAISKQLERAP